MNDELFKIEPSLSPEAEWKQEQLEIERKWLELVKENHGVFTYETPGIEDPWIAATNIPFSGHSFTNQA